MPPKPPFDMITTRSPLARLAGDRVDDGVDRRQSRARRPGRADRDQLAPTAARASGRRRSEDRREHHLVGARERPREVVLEHAPARRSGARLEHRPERAGPARRRAGRQAFRRPRSDGARSRRRPSRRARSPTTSSRRLTPANVGQPLAQASAGDARPRAPTAMRGERVAHVVLAEQRHLEPADESRRPVQHGERGAARPLSQMSCACQSASAASPKVCTRHRASGASAAASGLSAPSSSRPRRGTRFTRRRKARRTASRSA